MKNIETESFKFLTFDSKNKSHQEVIRLINNDLLFRKYFGDMSEYFEDIDFGVLDFTGNYMVYLNNSIVGFISLYDYYKYSTLHYGLLSNYRGMRLEKNSVAVSMIKEFSDIIFENAVKMEYLAAYIDRCNIKSIETAKKAGFVFYEEKILNNLEYRKYRNL